MKTKRMFHRENILNFRKKMEEHKIDKINMASGTCYDSSIYLNTVYMTILTTHM